jgi:hypothetical protein
MYVSIKNLFISLFLIVLALYLGFAREMVKICFHVPNVSAGNITLRHEQRF